jgi:hypothetical protein
MSSEKNPNCRKIALRCRKNALNEAGAVTQVGWCLWDPIQLDRGGTMSRRIRYALSLLLVSFALTAAACADASGPSKVCDTNNPVTC